MVRLTEQFLLPKRKPNSEKDYDLYPTFPLTEGNLGVGYQDFFKEIEDDRVIILDGYIGVDWEEIINNLECYFKDKKNQISIIDIRNFYKNEDRIKELVSPFLGGDDPVFGKKTNLNLIDYFNQDKLSAISSSEGITIVYGIGSSLCNLKGRLIYFDLPKNELQYRMRANSISNLGMSKPKKSIQAYKHFYFVDWIVLNKEKQRLVDQISIFVDQQRPGIPVFSLGDGVRKTLSQMSKSYFRVRPWFEPGVWGGDWIKERFEGLNIEVPNYAWSFEMIIPENGIILSDDNYMLELSFDFLMYLEAKNILGKAFKRFQYDFPIRFDFLDTFNGGNLSVQCHPTPQYIRDNFGESFTQDETYYILDNKKGANVYLGFQEDIDPDIFRGALNSCFETKNKLDVEKYVQKFPSDKHTLYLIPHGTVHCSGKNNLVLEISATPYIYTFKMYDWQRLNFNGLPRPLNIDRAMDNLNFERKGQVVQETLISKPVLKGSGEDWKVYQLPTHPDQFYEVYRYEFETEITISTESHCHILMLVEGVKLALHVDRIPETTFHFAETFAIPAASEKYKLSNLGKGLAKVVVSFVKDESC